MKSHIYPIFIPHAGCQFTCIYCDQHKITHSKDIDWDTTNYNINRFIKKYAGKDKEIAFFGGTFTCLSKDEMKAYFERILPLFDDQTYFRISTRPDAINPEILSFLQENKVRTIELGIQSFSDIELKACERGYSSETAISACQLVLESGFKLCVQLMIGLPEATGDTYNETLRILSEIRPDYVRLYPLVVLKGTQLENMYLWEEYKPLKLIVAVYVCKYFYERCVLEGIKVIKIGLHSDIDPDDVVAGPYHSRFGEMVRES